MLLRIKGWREIMTNLDAYMEALREEMQQNYFEGNTQKALELSRRLDRLIALKQRERGCGQVAVPLRRPIHSVPSSGNDILCNN